MEPIDRATARVLPVSPDREELLLQDLGSARLVGPFHRGSTDYS